MTSAATRARLAVTLLLVLASSCSGARSLLPGERICHGLDGPIGTRTSLREVRKEASYRIRLPAGYEPELVTRVLTVGTGDSMQVYVGFTGGSFIEFLPKASPSYAAYAALGNRGEQIEVRGRPAYVVTTPRDQPCARTHGLLRWHEDGVEHVIGGDLSKGQMIEMATSLEP